MGRKHLKLKCVSFFVVALIVFSHFYRRDATNTVRNILCNDPGKANQIFKSEFVNKTHIVPDGIIPQRKLIPEWTNTLRVVHLVWCGNKEAPFSFKHYLSVQSIVIYLQPDVIYFHCIERPNWFDKYHSWFNETLENNPWFLVREDLFDCSDDMNVTSQILHIMNELTGVYIGQDTVITSVHSDFWNINEYRNTLSGFRNGYMIVPLSHWESRKRLSEIDKDCSSCRRTQDFCVRYEQVNNTHAIPRNNSLSCIFIEGEIYPKDIWHRNDTIGKVLNYLFYGQVRTPIPEPSSGDLIPNVGHMIWVGGQTMKYIFYLSALSMLYIVKVDMLFIHGDYEPYGPLWAKLKGEQDRVKFIKIEVPKQIHNAKVQLTYHLSDMLRVKILSKYGGIYNDVDAIWTQPLPEWLRRYDAVASLDWAHNHPHFPDYLNLGVTLSKPHAPFWKYNIESMKHFHDEIFGYPGLLAYKIYEHHPEALFVHKPLQVMCFRDQCYPLSGENFTTMDWKRDTYAFHWTYPDPVEFSNKSSLLASDTMFAQMGQQVLRAAGEI